MLHKVRKSLSLLNRKQKITYLFFVVIRSILGFMDVAGVVLVGYIAAKITQTTSTSNFLDAFPLSFLLPAVLIIFMFKGIFAVFLQWRLNIFLARIETAHGVRVAERLAGNTLDELSKHSSAEINFASIDSSSSSTSSVLLALVTIVSESTLLILMGITFLFVDTMATLFVFLYFAITVGLVQAIISKRLKDSGRSYVSEVSNAIDTLNSLQSGFREISVLRKIGFFISEFKNSRRAISKSLSTQRFLLSLPRYVIETTLMVGVLLFIGWQIEQQTIQDAVPVIGVFLVGGVRMMGSLVPLQTSLANLRTFVEVAQPAIHAESISLNPHSGGYPNIQKAVDNAPWIELNNVTFTYPGTQDPVLDGFNMRIEGGSQIAIIGVSGSGKTTLVDLLLGLYSPNNGDIYIEGKSPNDFISASPGSVAYVSQKPSLIPGSVAANIALGESYIDQERLDKAVNAASLREFIQSLPEGVNTDLGKQIEQVSGGQAQRIGLARALYFQPKLLVLDEATSALDAVAESNITKNLKSLGFSTTVIVIAHRLSTIQTSNKVFFLSNGKIKSEGTFSHLRKTDAEVENFVRLMSFE